MHAPWDAITPPGEFEGYFVPSGLDQSYFQCQHEVSIVHVKGSGQARQVDSIWNNPAGHTLLWLGTGVGFVHSCDPGDNWARYIPSEEWGKYCREMGKPIEPEQVVTVGHLITKRMQFISSVNHKLMIGWDWCFYSNCSTMVDKILGDGGVPATYHSKCLVPSISVSSNKKNAGLAGIVHDRFPWGDP
jgi:hypothetical protein